MKKAIFSLGLVLLAGCSTAPPAVSPTPYVRQAYYVPPGGFADTAATQCQMTLDATEFATCTQAVRDAQGGPLLAQDGSIGTDTASPASASYGSPSGSAVSAEAYPTTYSPSYSVGQYGASTPTYTGNCPTPESLDAAGHRCGARSAGSRPGGYDGYGSWARSTPSYGGGTTYVRGYYRKNGTYVRPHTRRR